MAGETERLSVQVEGQERLEQLATLITPLGKIKPGSLRDGAEAGKPQLVTSIAGRAAANLVTVTKAAAGSAISAFTTAFSVAMVAIKVGMQIIFRVVQIGLRFLVGVGGPLGIAISAIGAVIGGFYLVRNFLLPMAKLAVGMELLKASFNFAQEQAAFANATAALARRRYPGLSGFEGAEQEVALQMRALSIVMGDEAEGMIADTIRRFRDFGRKGGPDMDPLARLGLTRDVVADLNARGVGTNPVFYLEKLVQMREGIDKDLRELGPGYARTVAYYWKVDFLKNVTTVFGTSFAKLVQTLTPSDVEKIKRAGAENDALGFVADANRKAINLRVAAESLRGTFAAITEGIGGDIQPTVTRILDGLRRRLIEPDAQGRRLGDTLRRLAGDLAIKAFEIMVEVIKQIDWETLKGWIKYFKETFVDDKSKVDGVVVQADKLAKYLGTGFLGWLFGVNLEQTQAETAAESQFQRTSATRPGGAGAPGEQPGVGTGPVQLSGNTGAEAAVDEMMKYEGMHEVRDRALIHQYLKSGGHGMDPAVIPWCAAFVNAALQRAGIKGTHSNLAASFYRFGTPVRPGEVAKGDVLVAPHHVGLATGRRRSDGAMEMISGNSSDMVRRTWVSPGSYRVQRPPPAQQKQSAIKTDAAYQVAARNAFEEEVAAMNLLSAADRRKIANALVA